MSERDDATTSREINASAGHGSTLAFELVLTPAIFAVLGWLLDRAAGTSPVFLIVFPVIVGCYEVWKIWRDYSARMVELESQIPKRRPRPGASHG